MSKKNAEIVHVELVCVDHHHIHFRALFSSTEGWAKFPWNCVNLLFIFSLSWTIFDSLSFACTLTGLYACMLTGLCACMLAGLCACTLTGLLACMLAGLCACMLTGLSIFCLSGLSFTPHIPSNRLLLFKTPRWHSDFFQLFLLGMPIYLKVEKKIVSF